MINMGFGDCFVVNKNNYKLLVDCGTKYKRKYKNSLVCVDSDVDEILITRLDIDEILITHFHADHYNCIADIKFSNLKKIYLPPLFYKDKYYLSIFVLLSLISKKTDFYKFLDWLKNLNARKEYLYTDNKFFNDELIAISPFVKYSKWDCLLYNGRSILFSLFKDDDNKLRNFINRIYSFLRFEEKDGEGSKEDKSFYEEFISLCKFFKKRDFEGEFMYFLPLINFLRALLFEKIHDNCIVFQNANECENKNILFCADASKTLIDHIIEKRILYKSYEVIKLPHHGTDAYSFVVSNPSYSKYFSSKCYFIPNDNSIKKWSISQKVLNPLCSNNSSIITCDLSKNVLGSINYIFCSNKCFCVNI